MNCIHGYGWGMCPYGCCQYQGVNYQYQYPIPLYNCQCPKTTDISGAIIKTIEWLRRHDKLKEQMTAQDLANVVRDIAKDISDGSL